VSDNWIVRRRPWKALTTAVLTTTSVVWVPQAEAVAATSGAFVSQWDGPIVSRQFQFQSVAKPVGEPVADPSAETPFGWRSQYVTPERKPSRAHLAEGVSRPLGALEAVQIAWHAPLSTPTVRVSRTALAEGVAWTPQEIAAAAGATTPSDWWGDKYGTPRYPPTRVALLDGYVKPWHQPADAVVSSGAFTSSWDGPIVSRQFQYQSKVAPVSQPLVFFAAQSAWDGPYFFKAFLYEEMASFVKAPDAAPGASTPSELGWGRDYAEPIWRKRLEAGSTATVFVPPTFAFGWGDTYSQPRFPSSRVALVNGYSKPFHQPADPEGTATPSELGWQLQYSSPPKQRHAQQFWTAWAAVEAPAVTPSILGWQRQFDEKVRRKRTELDLGRYVKPWHQPVDETSGAFVVQWDAPLFGRRFMYQAVVRPVGDPPIAAVTPSQLAFWSLFGGKPAAKLATPWFYPSDFYTVGQTDGGSTPPLVEELHAIEFIGTVGKLLTR
jgi:hypothetical protein